MYQSELFKCNTLAGGGKVSCFLGTQEARGGEASSCLTSDVFCHFFHQRNGSRGNRHQTQRVIFFNYRRLTFSCPQFEVMCSSRGETQVVEVRLPEL